MLSFAGTFKACVIQKVAVIYSGGCFACAKVLPLHAEVPGNKLYKYPAPYLYWFDQTQEPESWDLVLAAKAAACLCRMRFCHSHVALRCLLRGYAPVSCLLVSDERKHVFRYRSMFCKNNAATGPRGSSTKQCLHVNKMFVHPPSHSSCEMMMIEK